MSIPQPYNVVSASINVLPTIGQVVAIYFTVIDNLASTLPIQGSVQQATITNLKLVYGSATIDNTHFTVIANDNSPVAIEVAATYDGIVYVDVLYFKAIYYQTTPDNFQRIVQKIPKGIFTSFDPQTSIIGADVFARASMADDYYDVYNNVANQVFSTIYSSELEFEFNGTVGLLSNSVYIPELFQLLSALATVKLTIYDLELFFSKYINFRLGLVSAVYIDDHLIDPAFYWVLGVSTLGDDTILAPEDYDRPRPLNWNIYNASSFTIEFKEELQLLVNRISRADIGNIITYYNDVHPPADEFDNLGGTYPNDYRLVYGRCLEYQGIAAYPVDVVGYLNLANAF